MIEGYVKKMANLKGIVEDAERENEEKDFEAILREEGLTPEPGEALFPEDVVGHAGAEEAQGAAEDHETVSLSDRLLGSLSDESASNEVDEALLDAEGSNSVEVLASNTPAPAVTEEDLLVMERVRKNGYAATMREAGASEEAIRRLADAGLANLRADGRETVLAMAGATDRDVREAGARARADKAEGLFLDTVEKARAVKDALVSRAKKLTVTETEAYVGALVGEYPREAIFAVLTELRWDEREVLVMQDLRVQDEKAGAHEIFLARRRRASYLKRAPIQESPAVSSNVHRALVARGEEETIRLLEATSSEVREKMRKRFKTAKGIEKVFAAEVSGYDPRDDERPEPMAYLRGLVALLGFEGGTEAFAWIVRNTRARMGLDPAARASSSLAAFVAALLGPDPAAPVPLVAARLACRALEGIKLLGLGRWPAEVFAKKRNARRRTIAAFALLGKGGFFAPQVRLRSGSLLLLSLHRALDEVEAQGSARAKVPYDEVLRICKALPFKAGYDFFGWEGEETSEARYANRLRMRAEFVERRRSGEALVVRPAGDLDAGRLERKNDPSKAVVGPELREAIEEQSRAGRGRYNARRAQRCRDALKGGRAAPLGARILGHIVENGWAREESKVRRYFAGTPTETLDAAFAALAGAGRLRRLKSRKDSKTYLEVVKAAPATE